MTTSYFRHPRTGRIGAYSPEQAAQFNLIEVGRDAKPLAYSPIPEADIEALLDAEPEVAPVEEITEARKGRK